MNDTMILFLLWLVIAVLAGIILYQRAAYRTGTQRQLREISAKLKEITAQDSGEQIMVFTENGALMELAAQINNLLEQHLRVKADYRRSEMASKKMLSNISHDIKTPMTVILGYLEIMRINAAGSDGTQDEMLKTTEQKAQAVMTLIDQFFTLAKLESGDTDMELSRINLSSICRESVLDFYEILTKNGFTVDIDIPEDAVFVMANLKALQRILYNLISNVIRYGADGRYLGVSLRSEGNMVFVDVADKGKGIEKAFLDSVFDRLFTMEDSRSRSIQGNGLGLTIARNLARQLGGDLTLESTPYVKTTFTLTLKKIAYESDERNL